MARDKLNSSFRDPSGFVYKEGSTVYRQINKRYQLDYDLLMSSGLYQDLVDADLLVSHKEVDKKPSGTVGYKVIKPEQVEFISYPYEWSYGMYKDTALTTLEIQRRALKYGMSLKDATAYNIQFIGGVPKLIDTLSFEKYKEGEPWVAYRQFCQHFLAPLLLMTYTHVDLSKLMRNYIDGVPLELAAKLLPNKLKARPQIFAHIFLHARSQSKHAQDGKSGAKKRKLSKTGMLGIVTGLASTVSKLQWKPSGTEWGDYYTFTNYTDSSFAQKRKLIDGFITKVKPKTVWDVGANNGLFSRIASTRGVSTLAFDIDPIAVEKNYRQVKDENDVNMLPLVMDLTNPSPSLGWANGERDSMTERGPADMVFSLALIHHLALSNNVPLGDVAGYMASIGRHLVMEFVPKGDSQVDLLLATREDIFDDYHEAGFEKAFSQYFKVVDKQKIRGSKRTLYLLKRK